MDAHNNPIYDHRGPRLLFNDSIVQSRDSFNASTDTATCPKCQGLPATHGGNEVTAKLEGSRTTSRFVDSSHQSMVASMGATGSQFFQGGCFSADACPQWKLAWYDRNESAPGGWSNRWRTGKTSLGGDTGAFQFNKGTSPKEGQGVEPMTVHPVIGNVIAVTDQMMAGLLLFTTDGLYTLGTAPGGAPGYRKGFDFGTKNVYVWPGEYFGGGSVFLDPLTQQVFLAWGKTTVMGYKVPRWTADGVQTQPLVFKDGASVTLTAKEISAPPQIARSIRGYPPAGSNLTVSKASQPPALDGTLDGWDAADIASFQVDGLNTDAPAQVEARLLHGAGFLYISLRLNQSATGWTIEPQHLLPANRLFMHDRGVTTCSVYIQGNLSEGHARANTQRQGRPGDVRLVFSVVNNTALDSGSGALELAVLGMYPFCSGKSCSPATYAAGTGTLTFQNVALLTGLQKGWKLSPDATQMDMSAAIPRSAIPGLPDEGNEFLAGGDFSCNVQGFQKGWWVNADMKASQITWDEPSEASLYPHSWGNFSFVKSDDDASFGTEAEIDAEIARLQALKRTLAASEAHAPTAELVVYREPKFAQAVVYNVTYAQGQNCSAQGYHGTCEAMDLVLDVHTPALNTTVGLQPHKLMPAVIFFHGGGWGGGDKSGAGGQPYMTAQCQRWASRGFVVFNVDYRLGVGGGMWDEKSTACPAPKADGSNARYQVCGDFPPCCTGPTKNPYSGTNKMPPPHWGHFDNTSACERDPFDAAPTRFANSTQCPPYTSAYPASRDAKAAVRFVRKNAARFGVSPDHLIALGCSAGGWTTTTLAIAAEAEWRDELLGHDPTLASTNLDVSSKVQAAVVMSGGPQAYDMKALALGAAFVSPYDETDAPMIMLHGADDFIVNVTTNVGKNRAGYKQSGVPFEAHVFPNTSHCELDVESESSVVLYSIPFVAKHTGLVLKT